MSRLEDLVREALAAHEAGAPEVNGLLDAVRKRSARRRRRDWLTAATAAAVVVSLAVTASLALPGRHPGIRPAFSPSPHPARTLSYTPPAVGMPGLVQVGAAAFPTREHGVVFVQQCHPCQARGGSYTSWVAVTDNGGRSWIVRKITLPLSVPNFAVAFADASNGWTENGYVTHDGGLTWRKASIGARWTLDSISVSGGKVWAVAECAYGACGTGIFAGRAAGSALVPVPRQPLSGYQPGPIVGQGDSTAYIARQSGRFSAVVYATHDGGRSWQELPWPCPAGSYTAGVLAAGSPSSLWQACNIGVEKLHPHKLAPGHMFLLAHSADGGMSWRTLPNPMGLIDLQPVSARTAWGWDGIGDGGRTTDGGLTWRPIWSSPTSAVPGTPEDFSSQTTVTAEVTVAVSAARGTYLVVYRTQDGGRTWRPSVVPLPAK